jgi:hypothetical protein
MPPVSAPRHPANQSGPPNFGTGLHRILFSFWYLDWPDAGQSGIYKIKKIAKSREYQVTL